MADYQFRISSILVVSLLILNLSTQPVNAIPVDTPDSGNLEESPFTSSDLGSSPAPSDQEHSDRLLDREDEGKEAPSGASDEELNTAADGSKSTPLPVPPSGPALPDNQLEREEGGEDAPPGVNDDEPHELNDPPVDDHGAETEHDVHDDKHDDKRDDDDHKDSHKHSWGYRGQFAPGNWSLVEARCSANMPRQSPIDIRTSISHFLSSLDHISLVRPEDEPATSVTVVNNGHSVYFKTPFSLRIVGGDLGGSFRAAGLHFHWGENSKTGSEHTIDGMHFPLEMHIVTYNEEKYDNLLDAVNGVDSLAVLGVLFQVSEADNPQLEPIVSALEKVRNPGVEYSITNLDVAKLLPENTMEYYRYEGSLTTPPCAESVIWTVFRYPVNVSEKQLEEFRELMEESHDEHGNPFKLAKNWRPAQPLHKRLIYRSFALPANSVERLPYERAIAQKLSSQQISSQGDSDPLPLPRGKPVQAGNSAPGHMGVNLAFVMLLLCVSRFCYSVVV